MRTVTLATAAFFAVAVAACAEHTLSGPAAPPETTSITASDVGLTGTGTGVSVMLVNRGTPNACANGVGYSTAPGTRLELLGCRDINSERFVFTDSGQIRTADGVSCLQANNGSTAAGTLVVTARCGTSSSQRWTFTDQSQIRGVPSGLCVGPSGDYLVLLSCADAPSQRWERWAKTVADPALLVSSVASDRCAKVGGPMSPNTAMISAGCADAPKFTRYVNGELRALDGSLCVDVSNGGSPQDGDSVVIRTCSNSSSQRWALDVGGQLRGAGGKCLGVKNGSTAQGAQLEIRGCSSSPAQQWSVSTTAVVDTTTPPPPAPASTLAIVGGTSSLVVGDSTQLSSVLRDSQGVETAVAATWQSSDANVASVSSTGLVKALAAGSATITASASGQQSSTTISVSVPSVASVAVSPASASLTVGQGTQLAVTARDANGNVLQGRTASWSSSAPAIAAVDSNGYVKAVAAGSATITATVDGVSATASISVAPVPVASVSVAPGSSALTVGQGVQLVATARDASGNTLSGRTVTWSSSAPGIASVSSSGYVTAVAAGSATITAKVDSVSATATVSVSPVPVASVSVSPASASLTVGQGTQLVATARDANGNTLSGRAVSWSSSASSVASVSASGYVTAVAAGSATINATIDGVVGSASVAVTAPSTGGTGGTGSAVRPNEPGGLTRIVENSFDQIPGTTTLGGVQYATTGGSWITYEQTALKIVDDPTAPVSGPKVAEVTWWKGLDDGERNGSLFQGRFGADYKELYVSYRFKIVGSSFENQTVGTKLLGYISYGGYERENQFYWLLKENDYCNGDGPGGVRSGPFQLESRVSYPYTQYLSDGISGWHCPSRSVQYIDNNHGTGLTIRPGEWVHLEAYFKLNTRNADGSYNRDGVLKEWINGQLVQSATNIDWLTPETGKVGNHGFYQIHFDPIWGGNSGQIKSRDDKMLLDHIYASGTRQ